MSFACVWCTDDQKHIYKKALCYQSQLRRSSATQNFKATKKQMHLKLGREEFLHTSYYFLDSIQQPVLALKR